MKGTGLATAATVLLLFGLLTSCVERIYYDFNTHPSILRGDWKGIVKNFPREGDATELSLLNLEASYVGGFIGDDLTYPCDGITYCRYTFSGTIAIGNDIREEITGDGDAGTGGIYVQTVAPKPPAFLIYLTAEEQSLVIRGFYINLLESKDLEPEEPPSLPYYASSIIVRDSDGGFVAEYPFDLVSGTVLE